MIGATGQWFELARSALRSYGPRGLRQRVSHELKRRTGAYRRPPATDARTGEVRFPALSLDTLARHYAAQPGAAREAVARAERLLAGHLSFFGGDERAVRFPPAWHTHPLTGAHWPEEIAWSQVETANLDLGDIKWLWEPARFGWVEILLRADAAAPADRWARAFGDALTDFCGNAPPYLGPHWNCGQEVALRLIAVTQAMAVWSAQLSDAVHHQFRALIHASATRISMALGYAISQRNNHGISELAGLWTATRLLPNHPQIGRWTRTVERELPRLLADQFADDGGYIQESLTYQSLALDTLRWIEWVSEATGAPAPAGEMVRRAIETGDRYLAAFRAPAATELPNYGHCDGSHLPNLFAVSAPMPTEEQQPLSCLSGGNVISRVANSMALIRAPRHRIHRPAHADALHVDLWVDGANIAADPGTFAYTAHAPWDNGLARTRVHNTCSVGSADQMRRRGRFFWTHWSQTRCLVRHSGAHGSVLLLETHADCEHRFRHQRLVLHRPGSLLVLDSVDGDVADELRLHWNLAGDWKATDNGLEQSGITARLTAAGEHRLDIHRGDDDASLLGWLSPTYGLRLPCTAVELTRAATSAQFCTIISWENALPPGNDLWQRWQKRERLFVAELATRLVD